MKNLIFIALTLLSVESFANLCEPLFNEDLQVALEDEVFFEATPELIKDIKPDTRELLIDEKVEVGDSLYVEFLKPILKHHPATSSSVEGHMLGTKMMIDPANNQAKLYYFVLTETMGGFQIVVGFKEENIDYDASRVIKRENYHRKTLN